MGSLTTTRGIVGGVFFPASVKRAPRRRVRDVANTFPDTLCVAFRRARRPTHEKRKHCAHRKKKVGRSGPSQP